MSAARIALTPGVGLGLVNAVEKMALTDRIAVMVTTQRPLPLQPPPLHPLKTAPAPAFAVRVTIAPLV